MQLTPLKTAFDMVQTYITQLSDTVLAPVCLSCQRPSSKHHRICPDCWSQINFITKPYCDVLGLPLPFHIDGAMISTRALTHPPIFDHARSAAYFDGPMRHLIHSFKYADRHEALACFAQWLVYAGKDLFPTANMLIPVPLHYDRLRKRRFNQSAMLAKELSRKTKIPNNAFLLQRRKNTPSQVGLTFKQRQKNVSGAFYIEKAKQSQIDGAHVILVDDVFTSGATVEACAKCLKTSGAKRVDVLTLARVVDPTAPLL